MTGEYVEELESSLEGSIYSGISSNEDYISRSKTKMSELEEDIKLNNNKLAPIYRQINVTDIPNSHELQTQMAKKSEKKLLIRGKGVVPLNKVSPEDKNMNLDLT